jgi:hypothetical protein
MRSNTMRKASPRLWRVGLVLAIAAGAMAAFAAAYGVRLPLGSARLAPKGDAEPSAVASIAGGERPTTIIVSTPNSNDCRRYQLDVSTGARNEQGAVNCAADGANGPGRLETISKSFRNR